jgi:hypothetical protein
VFNLLYVQGKIKQLRLILSVRLGLRNDLVGYETLLKFIVKNNIASLNGDFLEIGAFLGGGSAKLAKYCKQFDKKLFVVDPFDPSFDKTVNSRNESMAWIYNKILGKKDLWTCFKRNTRFLDNIVVYHKSSMGLIFPNKTKFCFAFIDGCHDPKYIINDFGLAWERAVPGGIVAVHDYGGALNVVTKTIDDLIRSYRKNIANISTISQKSIIFIQKK